MWQSVFLFKFEYVVKEDKLGLFSDSKINKIIN